jgi:hypothetical protein
MAMADVRSVPRLVFVLVVGPPALGRWGAAPLLGPLSGGLSMIISMSLQFGGVGSDPLAVRPQVDSRR